MAADSHDDSSRSTRPADFDERTDVGDLRRGVTPAVATHHEHPVRLGPYRILDLLGEGGMGVVYLAEQLHPIERRVALKVIRGGRRASSELRQRFEVERRTLARLDHPSIAKVFDAGETPEGDPYFAMELVEGRELTIDADARRLDVASRVRLLAEVARSIHHAHQKGVIHRDLKPSNVLVSEVDGRPVPRIIDFGIAKALDADPEGDLTRLGNVLGTPAYLSPESLAAVEGDGDVDVRSDVYALGVMLFELLVGERPFKSKTKSLVELIETIRQGEVPAPSARLAKLAPEKLEKRARARSSSPRALLRAVKGELDWITRRATEREREARYASAAELADDLDRYLEGRPVNAGPPSPLYRFRRFAGRHRLALGAGALVVASLVVGLVATTREAERARRAEAETNRVVDFLVELFEISDPGESRGETITARELLDRGSASMRAELATEPLVGARLLHTVGRVEKELGLWDRAKASAAEAVAIRRRELGGGADEVADSLRLLGEVELELGHYDDADRILREAQAIREQTRGERAPEVAEILDDRGHLANIQGRYPEAIELHRRALAMLEGDGPRETEAVARVLDHLAISLFDDGRPEEALPMFQRGRAIRERLLGTDDPQTVGSLQGEAMALFELGRKAEARALYEDVLARRERLLGPDHPDVAQVLNNLANVLEKDESERARALFERSAAIWEKVLGPDAPRRAISLQNLGSLDLDAGDLISARGNFAEAGRIFESAYGSEHPYLAYALSGLGDVAREAGDLEAAVAHFRQALAIRQKALRPEDSNLVQSANKLADVLELRGETAEAAELRKRYPEAENGE